MLFSSSLLAETKYTDKKILMNKKTSIIIGSNLSWVASCGETKFRSKKVKEIKSLSKYDYKNIMKGIASGTGTGNKVAVGCSSSRISQSKGWINDYVSRLTRLVNIATNGNIKESKNKELKKNNNNTNNDNSIELRLKKLKSLFDNDLITQDEYDAKKKEILDAM
mgnify:CR=1 FL=1